MTAGAETTNTITATPARGMRDMLPAEVALRDWAARQIIATYEKFGYTRIETPALEHIELLRGGEGGENLQLIFEVLKRGDKLEKELLNAPVVKGNLADLGLRFDLTVPLARFYANNQNALPNPFKAIQIGPVWRAESPQQGRYRQFTQCDIDVIGSKSEFVECELLQATATALLALGFKDFTIRINDRRILAKLAESCGFESAQYNRVFIALDKLDKIGVDGVRKELAASGHEIKLAVKAVDAMIRFLQFVSVYGNVEESFKSKRRLLEGEQGNQLQKMVTEIHSESGALGLPKELSHFFDSSGNADPDSDPLLDAIFARTWFPSVGEDLLQPLRNVIKAIRSTAKAYKVRFDPTLVRGMGYYTGQIFEISCPGYSSSVAGGGRYDKMIGKYLGRDVPACGFSIGFERIISILAEQNFKPSLSEEKVALIYDPDRDNMMEVFTAAAKMRSKGMAVSALPRKKDMKKQIDALGSHEFKAFALFKGAGEEPVLKPIDSK